MPFEIVRNDITKMNVDAIVNAANTSLLGGGGVDGAIHRAAGPELLEACRALHGCKTGEAKVTKGYRLPCRYVIHTVGPIWRGGKQGEREQLISCYEKSLALAKAYGCESVAFPMISAGVYGYPKAQALQAAMQTITRFLLDNEMMVYIVVFEKDAFEIGGKLLSGVKAYIDDVYVDAHRDAEAERRRRPDHGGLSEGGICGEPETAGLDEMLARMEESFTQMLLRKIDEKRMTDAACYKKANIDRRLFNKIKNNPSYKPGKQTALAFAVALELPLEETRVLLERAGYALSHSSKADIVVEYCIANGHYDLMEINEILFSMDLPLLGG